MSWMVRLWRKRRWMFITVGLLIAIGGTLVVARMARSTPALPMADVTSGEFVDHLQLRGNLKALKSVVMTAPSSAGELQIIQLVKNGTIVKKGDVVAQFDRSTLEMRLLQQRTELRQAESEIDRVRAQGRMTQEQAETELIQARYNVERARLEASKQEILSQIDGAKNKLDLANAEQKLKEIEQKLASEKIKGAADVASQTQKKEKSNNDVREAEDRIGALTLKAPVDGMVNLMPNFRARMGFGGGSTPEFKEGDRAWPGAAVVELPDMSEIRAAARIEEVDRGRVEVGQTAVVRVDAIPDREFNAKLVQISPLAKPDYTSWPSTRNFDIEVQLLDTDARLRPGMSASVRVAVERIADAVIVPGECVFQKSGRTVVYVAKGARFEEREIVITRRSGTQVAVGRGLKAGERLARKDPTLEEKTGEQKQ
ncbi:MAG: efflux RND transporter periplasmic adaptor subunit [Acidobacteria bacterium]|nr:efflux RND transporter periplasmic adaptor subunit [Acidobacteriota bacterium]